MKEKSSLYILLMLLLDRHNPTDFAMTVENCQAVIAIATVATYTGGILQNHLFVGGNKQAGL